MKKKEKDKEKSPSESSESKAPSVKSVATTTSVTPSMISIKNETGSSVTTEVAKVGSEEPKREVKRFGIFVKNVDFSESEAEKKSTVSVTKPSGEKVKSDKPKDPNKVGTGPSPSLNLLPPTSNPNSFLSKVVSKFEVVAFLR